MSGWTYLPRFVDKIRLHLAGKLHSDYQANFCKGFDERWLKAAGVSAETFIEVVRNTLTDGQVADWVRHNIKVGDEAKRAHHDGLFDYPSREDTVGQDRLKMRKEQGGLTHRTDITTFIDFIDADEKRI